MNLLCSSVARSLAIAVVFITWGLQASAGQQSANPSPPTMNPLDPIELLSSSGYTVTKLGDGFWQVLELKLRSKNLKSPDAILARSSDNKSLRVRILIGVLRNDAGEDELKMKLVDVNKT